MVVFRLVSRVSRPAWALAIRDGVSSSASGAVEGCGFCEERRCRFGPSFGAFEVEDWSVSPGRIMVGDAMGRLVI